MAATTARKKRVYEADYVKRIRECLHALQSTEDAEWFRAPVLELDPGLKAAYNAVVSSPMDLRTIQSKVTARKYETLAGFGDDVILMLSNALKFNPSPDAPFNACHDAARRLASRLTQLEEWDASILKQVSRLGSPTSASGAAAAAAAAAAPGVPKAARTPFRLHQPTGPMDRHLDLVWVKIQHWPWWPALALPPSMFSDVDRPLLRVPPTGDLHYVLCFGWESSEAFSIAGTAETWEQGASRGFRKVPKKHSKAFKEALKLADESVTFTKPVRERVVRMHCDNLITKAAHSEAAKAGNGNGNGGSGSGSGSGSDRITYAAAAAAGSGSLVAAASSRGRPVTAPPQPPPPHPKKPPLTGGRGGGAAAAAAPLPPPPLPPYIAAPLPAAGKRKGAAAAALPQQPAAKRPRPAKAGGRPSDAFAADTSDDEGGDASPAVGAASPLEAAALRREIAALRDDNHRLLHENAVLTTRFQRILVLCQAPGEL